MTFLKKHKNDLILVLALLVLAGGIWLYTLMTRAEGAELVVTVGGDETHRLPLNEDAAFTIDGANGGTNTVVISGGRARVTGASCPDHVCVRTGEIAYNGEMIVCLPNRVVVSVAGGESSGHDAVTG